MKNFWQKIKKPIFCLAPMADVTDCAFRKIICKYGKPDIFWTEFVSADGLAHREARKKLLIDLKFSQAEHPIVAQIFGAKPENIKAAAILCQKLGFDGIDINMGCPDKSIEKQGAGAAMIKNPKLAGEIIRAAKESGLPVSVKTRIGYNPPPPKGFGRASKNKIYLLDEEWIKTLLCEKLAALTVHLRTRKEMSSVPAHWELMPQIVALRNKISPKTLIIGNGDILSLENAKNKIKETGCDGVMLGRAIFGNPWLFTSPPTPPQSSPYQGEEEVIQKLKVLVEHTKLFEKMLMHPAKGESASGGKNFAIMKKHFKAYVNGLGRSQRIASKINGNRKCETGRKDSK